MSSVVVNDAGLLYGGFQEGKPVWFKTKRDDCVMDDATADAVVRQLKGLGFDKVIRRDSGGVIRKWVPSDLNATECVNAAPAD